MDAVLLALASAFLFGAMTVAIRLALQRGPSPHAGALFTVLAALAFALPFAAFQGGELAGSWPFVLAGLLGPGLSQILFTLAVSEAGPSRTSVVVGTAPLFSVAIALVLLDEPVKGALIVGAILIVAGGVLLVGESERPQHVRVIGLLFALAATVVFAVRDNLLRWLAVDTDVEPGVAAAATLAAGCAVILAYALFRRVRLSRVDARLFLPAGLLFGASYICLFEAYYRGPVTVVSPLIATESLWGVTLSAIVLRRSEGIGARLLAGAALIVCGGALIGVFR
ncbi:MAG: DMT family transporter [Gaiellaceae bacterium]